MKGPTKESWERVMLEAHLSQPKTWQLIQVAWWAFFNKRRYRNFVGWISAGMSWRFAYKKTN
jgi:hypothetical protein